MSISVKTIVFAGSVAVAEFAHAFGVPGNPQTTRSGPDNSDATSSPFLIYSTCTLSTKRCLAVLVPRGQSEVQPHTAEGPLDYPEERIWSEAFEHLGVAVAQMARDGALLTVNARLCEILGHSSRDLLSKNFREFFEASESQTEFEISLSRLIAGEIPRYSAEMTAKRAGGEVSWFETVFSLVLDNDAATPRRLILVAKDVTFLKLATKELHDSELARDELSRRVLNAQEADRTRIARELHDDIGQSLAVLKIQMLRAGQPVSGHPGKRHADLIELSGRLDEITHKVSRLSHGLHSSTLEFLGLAAAVESHCLECSQQLRIPVDCQCDQVRKELDGIMALSFLRVVQEALHNAAKHSRAKNIVVRLNGSDHRLSLEIYDDGVGFDMKTARLAAGLGLISMRERIHLIGGEFDIDSSPGNGTRITARAPIAHEIG
jgi:PAS domain S-box-containing protein